MADQSDEEFDEDLLNKPWDPVSYFDEEQSNEQLNKSHEVTADTEYGKNLTALFETNLHSVENDLQRVTIRRQSQQDDLFDLNGDFNEVFQNGDSENVGSIERFITYEDKEDHLKAVDNAFLINKKNINDDLKRFAHFKQNSIEQNDLEKSLLEDRLLVLDKKIEDSMSYDSGFSNEAASNVDEMISLMPDAVQELPENLDENDLNDGFNANGNSEGLELDLDTILPDAFSGDPVGDSEYSSVLNDKFNGDQVRDSNVIDSMNYMNTKQVESNVNKNLLIDFESKVTYDKGDKEGHSTHFDVPVSSSGSNESIDEVIKTAEAIVRDFKDSGELIDDGNSDSSAMRYNELHVTEESKHDNESFDLLSNVNKNQNLPHPTADGKTVLMHASSPLLPGLDRAPGIADTSVSSLHDELVRVSPDHDFNEPIFNGSEGISEDSSPVREEQVSEVSKPSSLIEIEPASSSLAVKKKVPESPRKQQKKGKRSSKSKYIVQVIKQGSEEAGTDSGSESEVSNLQSQTSIQDMLGNGKVCSETEMLLSDSSKGFNQKTKEESKSDNLQKVYSGEQSGDQISASPVLRTSISGDVSTRPATDILKQEPNNQALKHEYESGNQPLNHDHQSNNQTFNHDHDSESNNQSLDHDSESNNQSLDHDSESNNQSLDHDSLSNSQSLDHDSVSTDQTLHHDTQTESETVALDDIMRLTSEISEQFADEILNDNNDNNEQNETHGHDNVFAESSNDREPSSEVQNQEETSRGRARTGSTSDNEELEDFINQQLDAAPLPPLPDLPPPSVPDSVTQQAVEDIQLGWYAPKWIPDKDTRGCMNCGVKFTVVKRRHHCRACGKVMCANCCNMRAELPYLGYKPGRVCQACNEILSRAQSLLPLPLMTGSQDVPGRGHTISLNDSEPRTPIIGDSPPQYMPESPPEYSLVPGGAAQSGPPNPPSYFASSSSSSTRLTRGRTESDRSAVIMFNSSQTDLPPILRIENEVVKIINNPDMKTLLQQMKDPEADPVAFLVNKNLVVKLKVISFDCCIGKQCWCFSSDGMGASNQEEIIFIVEYKGTDNRLLKCVFQQLNTIFERAKHGEPVSDLGLVLFDEFMLNDPKNVGMLLFKQTVQCVKNIFVPCHPHLFGIWVQQAEIPWAKNLPLRLVLRLGAEFKDYPCPLYNLQKRDAVYTTLGRTIVDLLADFRNFQYTLPRITGLLISVSKKETLIKLPQSRYDEILKVLNVSEENVLAFCGNFHRKADSHLVCFEINGNYCTQTITCRSTNKKVTGCSFAVFSAALKQNPENIEAKSSVVEDGVLVQVTAGAMKKIRTAIKEMQDLVISPESLPDPSSNESNRLKLVWGSSDDSSTRTTSPIDGSSFDGLTNMRIRHSYDFTVSTSPAKIHWQEVFFLPNDADTVGRLSAKELSQMTSSVAKACMNALSPHLSTLVALKMTKIGLRISLESDSVEYQIGANKEQMPQELIGELDDKLIPVIHSVMKTVPHRRVSAELIFQIARIV